MVTQCVRFVLALGTLLGIQACDVIDDQHSNSAEIVFNDQTSLKLQPPALLIQTKAVVTESLAVEVIVTYSVGATDYRFEHLANRTVSEQGAFWLSDVDVPSNVPFQLAMTWYEESPQLDLLRITRQFEGMSSSGQREFAYQFSSTNEYSSDSDAPEYAGFDTDNDKITNLVERQNGTDPFSAGNFADQPLSVQPDSLELRAALSETSSTTLSVRNQVDIDVIYTASTNVNWLGVSPASGTVTARTSVDLNVSFSCSDQPGERTGNITVVYSGVTKDIPVELACSQILAPVLTVSTATLPLSALVALTTSGAIQIENTGTAPLNYTLVSNNDWIVPEPTSGALEPDGTEQIKVSATCGSIVETRTGNLNFGGNGGNSTLLVTLGCTAIPTAKLADISSTLPLSAKIGESAKSSIELSNIGDAELTYQLVSDNSWLIADSYNGAIAKNQSGSVSVTATCGTNVAIQSAKLSLVSNGGNKSVDVTLDCRGPVLGNVNPESLALAATVLQPDTASLTFTNTGNELLNFTIKSDSEWLCPDPAGIADCDVVEGSLSDELDAGKSYSLPIAVKCPSIEGSLSGSLVISGNVDSVKIPVKLDCNPAPLLAAEPTISYVDVKTYRFDWIDAEGADFYRLLENADADAEADYTVVASAILPGIQRYNHVVPLHLKSRARYKLESCNASQCVESSVISVKGTLVDAIGYIGGARGTGFGQALDISGDGRTLAVFHGITGAVSIFRALDETIRSTDWILDSTIEFDSDAGTNSYSAYSISLNFDGDILAVGLPEASNYSCECSPGTVHIYERRLQSGDTVNTTLSTHEWVLTEELFKSRSSSGDEFGSSVSLNGSGTTLMVGSPGSNEVHEYTNLGDWKPINVLSPSETGSTNFGTYLQLSADKGTLVVSADLEKDNVVYVFAGSNNQWTQDDVLYASNNNPDICCETYSGDGFGTSLSISGDGQTIAIGAPLEQSSSSGINGDESDNSLSNAGAAYVFTRSAGSWLQQAYIKASSPNVSDFFGYSLDVTYDGNLLAIGAWEEASGALGFGGDETADIFSGVGAGYLFSREGNRWEQTSYIKASKDTVNLGEAIQISDDGADLFISSSYSNELYYY